MNLTLAIVSAPVVDAAWLMQYISPENVSAILVAALSKPENLVSYDSAFSSEAALKFLGNNWLQCRPEVGGSGLMRANYMLVSRLSPSWISGEAFTCFRTAFLRNQHTSSCHHVS